MTMPQPKLNSVFRHAHKWSITTVLALILSACSSSQPEDLWLDYEMRVMNGLDIKAINAPANSTSSWPPLPPRKARITELIAPSMNLWEFLKVYDCELTIHVAKQNGPLGKVMQPSQRFVYAMKWIPLARRCLDSANLNDQARAKIEEGLAFYQAHQLTLFLNGVFHKEFETAFKPSAVWPKQQSYPALGDPSLEAFNQVLLNQASPMSITSETLEKHLKTMAAHRLPGNWLFHITQATTYLKRLNMAMDSQTRLCPMGTPSPQSKIAMNVFHRYFAAQVQPWVSQLHRFGQSLNRQLSTLSQPNPAMKQHHHAVFLDKSGPWQQFQQHWKGHVDAWQRQLTRCQLMPSAPVQPTSQSTTAEP